MSNDTIQILDLFKNRPLVNGIDCLSYKQLLEKKAENSHQQRKDKKQPLAEIRNFKEIPREDISWLWPGRIALGKLSMLAGDPGISKSLVTIDIAARLSNNSNFPDGVPAPIGDTIFLSLEDDPSDTIKPRLEAAKADLARCHFLDSKLVFSNQGAVKKELFTLRDLDVLSDALNQILSGGGTPLLLVIDPIDSFQVAVDSNTNDVRTMLAPIADFASKHNIAVLFIKHLNKNTKNSVAYRVNGHISYTAVTRSSWILLKDPKVTDKRLFLCIKNNIGKDNNGLSYTIKDDDTGIPYLEWNKDIEVRTPDEILSEVYGARNNSIQRDQVLKFLSMNGKSKASEIAAYIGSSLSSTSNILKKMLSSGVISNIGYGEYDISPPEKADKSGESDESDETHKSK